MVGKGSSKNLVVETGAMGPESPSLFVEELFTRESLSPRPSSSPPSDSAALPTRVRIDPLTASPLEPPGAAAHDDAASATPAAATTTMIVAAPRRRPFSNGAHARALVRKDRTGSSQLQYELIAAPQMLREAHHQLRAAHHKLQDERQAAVSARRRAVLSAATAQRAREEARVLSNKRDAEEKRLAKLLAAQRAVLEAEKGRVAGMQTERDANKLRESQAQVVQLEAQVRALDERLRVATEQRTIHLSRVAIGRITNMKLARAWGTWRCLYQGIVYRRNLAKAATVRMRNPDLAARFFAWRRKWGATAAARVVKARAAAA